MSLKPWDQIRKNGDPPECQCRCGAIFHAYAQMDMDARKSITETPCPGCGKNDNVWRVSYPPEKFTIQG